MNTPRSFVGSLASIAVAAVLVFTCSSARAAVTDASRYGGPVYSGAPAGDVTTEMLSIGGTPGNFSSVRTFNVLIGSDDFAPEIAKLRGQYGGPAIDQFLKVFDFFVNDAWKRAGDDNVTFPQPATLSNHDLAVGLIQLGTDTDGTYWTGLMLDKMFSHNVHLQVMDDIDAKYGEPADASYHKINDQLFYDLAQTLGVTSVKLAAFH